MGVCAIWYRFIDRPSCTIGHCKAVQTREESKNRKKSPFSLPPLPPSLSLSHPIFNTRTLLPPSPSPSPA